MGAKEEKFYGLLQDSFATPLAYASFGGLEKECVGCVMKGMNEPYTLQNLRHIAREVSGWEDFEDYIRTFEAGFPNLKSELDLLEHAYRYEEREGSPEWILDSTALQKLRCDLLLRGLRDPRFVREIGDIVERNPKDGKTELGGLIHYGGRGLRLREVPSRSSNSREYAISMGTLTGRSHIALFHTHALEEDCTRFAAPSYAHSIFEQRKGTDVGSAMRTAASDGESHQVVLTKLAGRRFNVDYFGTEVVAFDPTLYSNGKPTPSLVVTVVDLGVYSYK